MLRSITCWLMGFARQKHRLLAAGLAAAIVLSSAPSSATYEYHTARALFRDCSAAKDSGRWRNCAEVLHALYNSWQLEQGDRVCSTVKISVLPEAYVGYWRERGLGFLSGEFRSATASVHDFLDSARRPCPPNASKLPE